MENQPQDCRIKRPYPSTWIWKLQKVLETGRRKDAYRGAGEQANE
jgi:hypothetical protein